jgi:hypothetical protein
MVAMNLGVVALPVIELRNFVLDPLRSVLRLVGVWRGEITTALVDEPADAKVAADEVVSPDYALHSHSTST